MPAVRTIPAVIFLIVAGHAAAQEIVRGPSLGVVYDPARHALRPLLGVLGAAVLGDPIRLEFEIEKAAIAPDGSYALVRVSGAPELRIVRSTTDGFFSEPLTGALEEADRIVLSSGASAAVLYRSDAKRLQLLRGLPWEPGVSRDIDLSVFSGEVTAVAVSDDARNVLVAFGTPDSGTVWSFTPDGDPKSVLAVGRISAIDFLPKSVDALITDERGNTVYLLNAENASTVVAAEADGLQAPIGAQSSADRKFVFIAGSGNGRILILNREDGSRRELTCPCVPNGLTRMADKSVFRLNDVSNGPMWLLDTGSSEPRLLFVPPDRSGQE